MKKITITLHDDNSIEFEGLGMRDYEVLGLLKFYARKIEYEMIVSASKQGAVKEPKPRIAIDDFIQSKPTISVRLCNVLKSTSPVYSENYNIIDTKRNFDFLDQVKKDEFLKIRNAGLKSWHEFIDLIKN